MRTLLSTTQSDMIDLDLAMLVHHIFGVDTESLIRLTQLEKEEEILTLSSIQSTNGERFLFHLTISFLPSDSALWK